MMQTQIPSGLQALMQASQVLSNQASPTAPGPQGPQPTIAERVNQQIKQTTAPPEAGIAGLSPNMRDIGQQAGVAGQIMAQRAAQQEQTARNPEAIAQMAAQMMQSKGVAGLPAKMGFKEGGIIGYAGPDGSFVSGDTVADAQAIELDELRRQEMLRKRKEQEEQDRMRFLELHAPELAQKLKQQQAQAKPNITPAATDAALETRPRQTPPATETKLPARPAPTAPTPPAKPPIQAGIAAKIPETKVDTSGIAEPTIASLEPGITALVPRRAEAFNKEAAADEEARKKLKASMEDLNAKEIAALEESKKTRKQLAESKAERDQFNRVRAFFEDLGNRGSTSYRTVEEGVFARQEAERLADLAHEKAVILLQKAQQAEKLGDLDRAAALKKEAYARTSDEDKYRMEAGKIAAGLAQVGYTQKMETARTEATLKSANVRTEAELAQRDRALQANLEIERQKIAGLSAERRNSQQGQMLTAALGRLNDATRNYSKVADDNKSAMAMADAKDPIAQKMYTDAKARIDLAEKTYQEAKKVFDSISGEVLKGYATTPSSESAAKPDFVFDSKTGKMVPNK